MMHRNETIKRPRMRWKSPRGVLGDHPARLRRTWAHLASRRGTAGRRTPTDFGRRVLARAPFSGSIVIDRGNDLELPRADHGLVTRLANHARHHRPEGAAADNAYACRGFIVPAPHRATFDLHQDAAERGGGKRPTSQARVKE